MIDIITLPLEGEDVEDALILYVLRFGGMCRDCADQNGACPTSGLPCVGADKAVRHVLKALRYGIENGFIGSESLASGPQKAVPVDRGAECEAAMEDARQNGTGFMVDGHRVSPDRIRLFHHVPRLGGEGMPHADAALARLTTFTPGGQSILTRARQLTNDCAQPGGLGVLIAGEDHGPGRVMVPVPVLQDLIAVAEAAGEGQP